MQPSRLTSVEWAAVNTATKAVCEAEIRFDRAAIAFKRTPSAVNYVGIERTARQLQTMYQEAQDLRAALRDKYAGENGDDEL